MSQLQMNHYHRYRTFLLLVVLLGAGMLTSIPANAQDQPPRRAIRSYIPPDQLVSFRPETPFNQFVDFLNPIFERVTGKQIVDPESRAQSIGITVAGAHFLDAFELVLEYNGLIYRETDRFFIVEQAPPTSPFVQLGEEGVPTELLLPATLDTREIEINAVLFSINLNKTRDIGLDWNVFFGGGTASGGRNQGGAGGGATGGGTGGGATGGGTGGTGGAGQQIVPRFFVEADALADALGDFGIIAPDIYEISTLTQFFRLLESEGLGETIANPRVTVQSGAAGRIQIGTDLPYVTRDFAGNTITQFVNTGIIIEVTPTLISQPIADSTGSPLLDFIHLNVRVDNSTGQVSVAGPIVDRSTANTQVLLLDGEQTVIGGLYTTEKSKSQRGIPILKDIPLLKYLFGVTQTTYFQRELVILLQAELVDPLRARSDRPFDRNLLEKARRSTQESIQGLHDNAVKEVDYVKDFDDLN